MAAEAHCKSSKRQAAKRSTCSLRHLEEVPDLHEPRAALNTDTLLQPCPQLIVELDDVLQGDDTSQSIRE